VDHHVTTPTEYFDQVYAQSTDPWRLATEWYEKRKYLMSVASLPHARYRRGFEPGCSVGVLTEMLAARCDSLIAADAATAAVAAARVRVAAENHVEVQQMRVPDDWPSGTFDLIVLSEFCYYLTETELTAVIARSAMTLDPGGSLVAVHWRHRIEDFTLTGDAVHLALHADPRLRHFGRYVEPDFQLDVFTRSTAAA
jgi:cyclopropane fatty-acyl-phospholipid synthase-like methyltransferase